MVTVAYTDSGESKALAFKAEIEKRYGATMTRVDDPSDASQYGYYGFSEVTVNVKGGATIGRGDDGKEHYVDVDDDGKIRDTIVPTSIGITKPATNLTYGNGAYIVFDGTVVALNADGTAWTSNSNYPSGIIPNNELTLSDTVADINKVVHADDDYPTGAFYVSDGSLFTVNWQSDDGDNYVIVPPLVKIVSMYNGSGDQNIVCISNDPFTCVYQKYRGGSVVIEGTVNAVQYQYNGQTYYYTNSRWHDPAPVVTIQSNSYTDLIPDAFAAAINGRAVGENGQPITLSWARPGDGEVLKTTYYISVIPAGGHGDD
jgi:hypothetical protein